MPIVGYKNKFVTGQVTDAGISSASPPDNFRMMKRDGSFNIHTVDSPRSTFSDYYIALIRLPMWKFTVLLAGVLLLLNLFFTYCYYLIGDEFISGANDNSPLRRFAKDFLFSLQSITPTSFGLSTLSFRVHFLSAFEVVLGLLIFAIVTGLIYGRFSKATARLIHSNNALISPYKSSKALTFRVGNARKNQLVNIDWIVMVAFNQQVGEKVIRRYLDLKLESSKGVFFPMVWTVVHPIDENSPLLNFTEKDFEDGSLEIIVIINGFDETFNQLVHTRFGFYYTDIVWGQKFAINFETLPNGIIKHHLKRINDFVPVELPGEVVNS
jgi:inward rectifier potassium channel